MPKTNKARKSINITECPKCKIDNFYAKGDIILLDGTYVNIYKCQNGHTFQDSYSLGPYNTLNKFRPPCPFKISGDETIHIVNAKEISHNRYYCKTCKKNFTYKNNNEYSKAGKNFNGILDVKDHNNDDDDVNKFKPTINEDASLLQKKVNNDILSLEDVIDDKLNPIKIVANNLESTNSNNHLNNKIQAVKQNSYRMINVGDNQNFQIEILQDQNPIDNCLAFKVKHSTFTTNEYIFQHINSDVWPSLTDDQILNLIGCYTDINKDSIDQIH